MSFTRKTLLTTALCMATSTALATPPAVPDEPTLSHYMLILPENLPSLTQAMKGRGKELGLTAEQNSSLAAVVLEVRDRLQPLLAEARTLEKAIAADALAGATPALQAGRLDRLQQLKRQAAEVHIDSIARIKSTLTPAQYAPLLALANAARTPADAVARLQGSEQAAAEALRLIDGGRYPESWAGASEIFRQRLARDDWASEADKVRTPLGKLGSRKLRSLSYATSLTDLPAGEYVTLVYDSNFSSRASISEAVIAVRERDGIWRLAGYFIQ